MSARKFFWGTIVGIAGLACAADRPLATGVVMGAADASTFGDDHMNGPLHRQMINIFVLPEMQSELGLSKQQTAGLRRLKQDLLAKSKDVAGQTATRRRELEDLLSGDTSRTRAVKALLEKIADLHAQLQYATFDTATKMKALLNDSQKAKFNAMKPADVHRLMMSRARMAEIQEMMQLMGGGEGIGIGMQGPMGPGGMGQAGMMHGANAPAN